MLDKSIWIFFFKQKKSLVFVVCPSHPFSGIYVWWSFGLCYFNTWVSIKCLLRGYVMLLVYFAKWKVRTQNKPATAETHSSSAVSWSLAVPISIQEPFFLSPLQMPLEHCGAKWIGLVTLQRDCLPWDRNLQMLERMREGWLLPAELCPAFLCIQYKVQNVSRLQCMSLSQLRKAILFALLAHWR